MIRRAGGLALSTLLGLGVGACFNTDSGQDCDKGTLSCACTAEGECESGLICIDNVCRNPTSGTDGTDGTGSATNATTSGTSTSTTDPGSSSSTSATGTTGGATATDSGSTSGASTSGGSTGATCVTQRFGENASDDVNGVTRDSFVQKVTPNANTGTENELEIDGSPLDTENTFIRFDLSSIPTTATVQSATLHVATNGTQGSESGVGDEFDVYVAKESWVETEVNWLDRQSGTAWSTPGCGDIPCRGTHLGVFVPEAQNTAYQVVIDAAVVQAWVDGTEENNGFTIGTVSTNGADLHSRESQDTNNRPSLEIEYCD